MIFNSEYNSSYDNMVVTESPYPLGLEGALMHVWENECNYNAMMKAVGISELRYYQETGGDLFVQEAGAFNGFINKAKAFFKKVIEKIKQICHKFIAVINQYTMDDKKFVKKYEKELTRRDYTDFEFNGYSFAGISNIDTKAMYDDAVENAFSLAASVLGENPLTKDSSDEDFKHAIGINTIGSGANKKANYAKDSDEVDNYKEAARAILYSKLTGASVNSMDSEDFRDDLTDYIYGDEKDTLDIRLPEIRTCLQNISKAEKDISYVNRCEKKTTSEINKFIKRLEKIERENIKYSSGETAQQTAAKNAYIKVINQAISVAQSISNDCTIAYGIITQALKDRNRQSKAICVKALSYKNKNESATYTESYYDNDDIFANVVIR